MHENGEEDVRGVYIVCVVSKLLGILDDDLMDGVVNYLVKCQTYEGGFSAVPGAEAHGG